MADSFENEFADLLNTRLREEINIMNYDEAKMQNTTSANQINESLMAQTHFVPNEEGDIVSVYIYFDRDICGELNDVGVQLAILHELYHIYYAFAMGDGRCYPNLESLTHSDMRFNTVYRGWIVEMFPDLAEYADILKYVGTENADNSGELPEGYEPIIDSIIRVK